jgi:sortase A
MYSVMPPDEVNDENTNQNLVMPSRQGKTIYPEANANQGKEDPALNVIRRKLDNLFDSEPNAKEELEEVSSQKAPQSKHQDFMAQLGQSGKSLAEIQTAWHSYYVSLPDDEKHQVWQEFYANHNNQQAYVSQVSSSVTVQPQKKSHVSSSHRLKKSKQPEVRTISQIKEQLIGKINTEAQTGNKHRTKSLAFGVSMGFAVILILSFGFFNERFLAPFITPSRVVGSTPIIISSTEEVGPEPKVIIPKINVDVPVVYTQNSVQEKDIQLSLENGIVHYPTTAQPGEKGNAAIFGHSSNNILNKGKYKFAFVLLNRLEKGDTFIIHKDGVRYVYKIFDRKIVNPNQLEVLDPIANKSTVSLITCDPPGTSLKRLVVIGEQISPSPKENKTSSADLSAPQPDILPSNAPSLWHRFVNWVSG